MTQFRLDFASTMTRKKKTIPIHDLDSEESDSVGDALTPVPDNAADIVDDEAELDEIADATDLPPGESQEETDISALYEEMKSNWQRERASFLNFKRRVEEEKAEIRKYASYDLAYDLLRVIDYFESSVSFAEKLPKEAKSIIDGVEYTLKELKRVLEAHGITPIEVRIGDRYDSLMMEAVERREGRDVEPETVLEIHRRGWRLHDRVLRSAQVVVSAPSDAAESDDTQTEGGDTNNRDS